MKKILVIQTAFIGDAILISSVLESLHRQFPEAYLALVVRKGNETIYENHPYVNRIYVFDKKNKISSFFSLWKTIRKEKFDLILNFHRYFSSGLLAVLSGAAEVRGFKKNPLSFFYTKAFPHEYRQSWHEIDRNHQLIRDLTTERPFMPRIYPSSSDYEKIRVYLTGDPFITLSPASVWFTKQLPLSKWIDLIWRYEHTIYLLGGPSDFTLCESLVTRFPNRKNIINLAGKLTILQSAALMKHAVMNYVNDSAPLHLASAVNAPVTVFYCSTVPSFGFYPLSDNSRIVQTEYDLSCRPCGLHGYRRCPMEHFLCGQTINVHKVMEYQQGN